MDEKLIELVREHPILYDTSHPNYLKTKLKLEVWEDITNQMNLTNSKEVKDAWEKLRHSYRDALRRQNKCIKSGAPATSIKKWKYQEQMGFLQPYMANRPQEGNLSNEETVTSNVLLELPERINNIDNEEDTLNNEILIDDNEPESPIDIRVSKKKIKKKDKMMILLQQSIAKREERSRARAQEREKLLPSNDPLYHFFMSLYHTTKTMPPSAQNIVKNKLFNVVSEMEANLLTTHTEYAVTLSAPNSDQVIFNSDNSYTTSSSSNCLYTYNIPSSD